MNYGKVSVKKGVVLKKRSKIDDFLIWFALDNKVHIVITSGYRDRKKNKNVGGRKTSKHQIYGGARDIRSSNLTVKIGNRLILEARRAGFRVYDERRTHKPHIHIELSE